MIRRDRCDGGAENADRAGSGTGLYIHIPFCRTKCAYCDFVSFPGCASSGQTIGRYIEALEREMQTWSQQLSCRTRVDTVYFGGGTPTLIGGTALQRIAETAARYFQLAPPHELEMSIEANPETVNKALCIALSEAGFNRVSLGVQSLDDGLLAGLGRSHDADASRRSYELATRLVTDNVSVDLMFGIPGQTMTDWKSTVEEVLSWNPAHLSLYSLQLEEGTPMYEEYRCGRIELPAWRDNRAMYRWAMDVMTAHGYERYEVSSVAKKGKRCRHNLKYWSMEEYIGLGLSAHSFVDGVRTENTSDLATYLRGETVQIQERGTKEDMMGDYLFTTLRRADGFSLTDFYERFDMDFTERYGSALEALLKQDLLCLQGGRIYLSQRGLDCTNDVMSCLLNRKEER